MGFNVLPDKTVVWTPPTDAEIAEVKDSILTPPDQMVPVAMPSSVQYELQRALNERAATVGKMAFGQSRLRKAMSASVAGASTRTVDVVVPIYNSLSLTRRCIEAVLANTDWSFKLILVNDASDEKTTKWVTQFGIDHPEHVVLHNKKNRGFAATVNRGILAGSGEYVCLLNSDVLVTPAWLSKLVFALNADPKNQIVNPITNNTALINVPMIQGTSYLDMNRAFEMASEHRYPEIMPTGFCFMFRRALIDLIGLFDEGYGSYGEETDFWMKTITKAGPDGVYLNYKAVMADDTYVYHERGSSFTQIGAEKHMGLRKSSNERFHRIWPGFKSWMQNYKVDKAIGYLRNGLPPKLLANREAPYNIAFLVHSVAYCGGMRFVSDIVNEINNRGGNAKVVLVLREGQEKAEPPLGELQSCPVVFATAKDAEEKFSSSVFSEGVVVACVGEIVGLVKTICDANPKLKPLFFSQSYDPDLAPTQELREELFDNITKLAHVITNADWLTQVYSQVGANVIGTVVPGVDHNTFYPRDRAKGDERPTFMLNLVHKDVPYRGYSRGIELAKAVWAEANNRGVEIKIVALGQEFVPEAPFVIGLGPLSQNRLATILGQDVDVFCDPATLHTYGMPVLEAMSSKVVPVIWHYVGDREILGDKTSGIKGGFVFDPKASPAQLASTIVDLLSTPEYLQAMKEEAFQVASSHDRDKAVDLFISTVERSFCLKFPKKKIVFITPHLRKHGGPTTIVQTANALAARGHDVSLATVYNDINSEVLESVKVPIIVNINALPACDILVTNSDNPFNDQFVEFTPAKHKVLLKLSHNARFKDLEEKSLNLPWDAIITSTDWLVRACESPLPDWNHPPQKATRVGWFHYGHAQFNCPPENRLYGDGQTRPIVIATLIHQHPLKGTAEALSVLEALKATYGNKIHILGIGETANFQCPPWMQYVQSADREKMSNVFRQTDIWLGASKTEGLGRMALEAMSSGVACVLAPTGAEFAKHEENCLIYSDYNPETMLKEVERLIQDLALARTIRKNGYETARAAADKTAYIQNVELVLQEVCGA